MYLDVNIRGGNLFSHSNCSTSSQMYESTTSERGNNMIYTHKNLDSWAVAASNINNCLFANFPCLFVLNNPMDIRIDTYYTQRGVQNGLCVLSFNINISIYTNVYLPLLNFASRLLAKYLFSIAYNVVL